VLANRTPWLARPTLPSSRIKQIDYLIDGKLRWTERRAPYSYGDDGEALVTSWLNPGIHRFTVTAVATSGHRATETVEARVLPTPEPPAALAGSWQRDVDTRPLEPLPAGIAQPSGVYRITFDRRWIQTRFPGTFVPGSGSGASLHTGHGWLIDAAWTPSTPTFQAKGSVSFGVFHDTDREGGFWCGPGAGGATYRWGINDTKLTVSIQGRDPCRYRQFVWAGTWTRVS
jgi:hypothetical protein